MIHFMDGKVTVYKPFCWILMKPADLDLRWFFSPQEHLIVPTGHLLGRDSIRLVWFRPPDKSLYGKTISLSLIQNICCGYSKEPSQ